MFGKIKGKLKDVFKSSEEVVEENFDSVEEVEVKPEVDEKSEVEEKVESEHILEDSDEEPKKKTSFLGKIFGSKKKDEEEISEVEKIEDEMLEEVPEVEKEAIKEHKELPEEIVEENKKELEDKITVEEIFENEAMKGISKKKDDFEHIDEEISEKLGEKQPDRIAESIVEEPVEEKTIEDVVEEEIPEEVALEKPEEEKEKKGFFGKTFSKLKVKTIDDSDFDKIWVNLQLFLLEINIAYEIVEKIEERLKTELIGNSFSRFKVTDKIREVLVDEVTDVLKTHEASFLDKLNSFDSAEPVKILVLGVNGTGKTTTIAKIVKFLQDNNKSVCVAAADTFRAAAVEQLEEHSKALKFKLIMHKGGSDPAAVAFDAISHAKAKKLDVVLIDTAGRMPNNSNLMLELDKVKRVSKSDMAIFVGDSVSGNDLIDQINLFNKGVEIDGTILTKVDTDERPGSIVTTAYSIDKPIYFLGVGQTYEDLTVFDSKHIAEKLFELDED